MSKAWSEVASSPAYQALPPDQQGAAREQYFSQVVAPQISDPAQQQAAKAQFDAQYGSPQAAGPAATAPQADPSMVDSLGRAAVMTGRAVLHGALGIPVLLHDALIRAPYNAISQAVGSDSRIAPGDQQVDSLLNKVGVPDPQPQNSTERVALAIDRGLGGGGAFVKGANALVGAARPLVSSIGEALSANAGSQVVSAGSGAGASALTKEAGGGQTAQNIAGLVGGIAPFAPQLAQAGTQGLLRGGELGRQQVANNIADFQAAGTMPTVGQATQNGRTQAAESLLSKTPGAAGQMQAASQKQAAQVAQGMEAIAGKLSPMSDPARAGRVIDRGISGAGGFMDRFKAESGQLYDKLDQFIPQDTRIDIANTSRILPELNQIIDGAPNTSAFFQNARIKGIDAALKSDATGADAALTRPDVQAKADQVKAAIDAQNQSITQANQAESARISQLNSVRVGSPPIQFTPKPLISPSEADTQVGQMASSMADGKLPYEAVKKLRSLVGTELENPSIVSDVPRSKWKAVYAALSQDLGTAADQAGPQAQQAFNRANTYYSAGSSRIDALSRVVDKSGGPEAIFNAATSGTKDGATTLKSVMQSLQPDEQKVLASTVIRRLGKSTPGQQNAAGDEFSMSTFLTNWNKLSPQAKSTLFGRFGSGLSDDMDSVANMAENVRKGSKVYANPSGTSAAGAQLGTVGAFVMSALTGHPGTAALIAGGAGTANLTARLMTNPAFVRWLAKQTKVPYQGQIPNVANLIQMSSSNDDPDLKSAADLIQQAGKQKPN